jgi:uncharacterized repeat protein (TIGR01451 family)
MLQHLKRLTIGALLVAPLLAAPLHAQTATPEGTVIKNKATATYSDANANTGYASVSDSVSVTVGFLAGVNPTSPASVTPASPSTADTIAFTLQNVGNGTDTAQVSIPAPGSSVTITGYRWNGTTYATVAALNTALSTFTLASGATTVIKVVYDVGNGAGGQTIPVSLTQTSKRSPTTSATTTTNVQPPGARAVAVTPKNATVTQLPTNGTPYTYTFTVTNNGNSSDTYNLAAAIGGTPAGAVTIVSVNGVAGTTGTTTLAAGASTTITVGYNVAFGVAAGTSDKIVFTATSQASAAVNDAGDVTVTVTKAAVTMTKTAWKDDQVTPLPGGSQVKPGDFIQYKVAVTNGASAAAAQSIVVSDALPAEVTYSSATGDATGWSISQVAGTVTASLSGSLAAGATRYFWIRVQVK